MTYIYVLLIVIALLLIYMYIETGWVQVSRVDFTKSRKGLKVLHISDIHIGMIRVPARKISQIVRSEKPDVIIITGDYVEKPLEASDFLGYLEVIKNGCKTYICLGNHDHRAYAGNQQGMDSFARELKALQVEVLQNRSVQLQKDLKKYNLIGIDDLREGFPDIDKALKGCSPDASTNITITHNPDLALQITGERTDYLFCGHFHGGQIWMPFNLEFFLLRKDKLCRKGIRRGLHKINDINVYINRGLGNVVVPLRFLSRPEVTVYNIP